MHGTVNQYSISSVIQTEKPHWCQIDVWHSEFWWDFVPTFVNAVTGEPVDLNSYSGLSFHLWIRPIPSHTGTEIDHLFSPDNGIKIDSTVVGRIHLQRPRETVDNYPIGRWHQWLFMNWNDVDYGPNTRKLLWYGPFIVHPGRYTAPIIEPASMGAGGGDMLGAGSGNTIGVD